MGKGKRVKAQRQTKTAIVQTARYAGARGLLASPWDSYLTLRSIQGHDVDALAALALTPFQATETGPGARQGVAEQVRLADLADQRHTTVADLAETLRFDAVAGRLRWDSDARRATVVSKPDLNLVLINNVLVVFPQRYVSEAICVARTSAGARCRNMLAHSQPAPWSVWQLPGEEAAYVQGFDLDDPDVFAGKDQTTDALKSRFLKQRCLRHRDSADTATAPEWETYDPKIHRSQVSLINPGRLDGATILPLPWPADTMPQYIQQRNATTTTIECPW